MTINYNFESCTDNTYATCISSSYPNAFIGESGNVLSIYTEDNVNVGFYKMTVYANLTNNVGIPITSSSESFNFQIASSCTNAIFDDIELDVVEMSLGMTK